MAFGEGLEEVELEPLVQLRVHGERGGGGRRGAVKY